MDENTNNCATNQTDERDDWKIDVTLDDKLPVPSFIRLFVMHRILTNYIDPKSSSARKKFVKKLVKLLTPNDNNPQTQEQAQEIMLHLITFGIKKHMEDFYDETKHATIIEQIFTQIILTKFKKEYQQVTKYNTDEDDDEDEDEETLGAHYYQNLLFNTEDLMCFIFQFLSDFDFYDIVYDLTNCSLVCSYWLYHCWNINSIYFVSIDRLIKYSIELNNNDNKLYSRMWQRLYNAHKINVHIRYRDSQLELNEFVLNKLAMFSNISNISGYFPIKSFPFLKVIMNKCSDKIERFALKARTSYNSDETNKISPLTLPNARIIRTRSLYFFIIWTNKCETLELAWIDDDIKKEWIQHVVDKCDCSGITELCFDHVSFEKMLNKNAAAALTPELATIPVSSEVLSLFETFAKKFINLRRLTFDIYTGCDDALLLLWKFLNVIMVKHVNSNTSDVNINANANANANRNCNDWGVKLQVFCESTHFKKINKMIEKNKVIIDEISLIIDSRWKKNKKHIIKLLSNKYLKRLQITNSDKTNTQFALVLESFKNETFLKQAKFDALKMIVFQDNSSLVSSTMKMVNEFLQLNFIIEKKLYCVMKFVVDVRNETTTAITTVNANTESNFGMSFENLCNNIYRLLTQEQIGFDITVTLKNLMNDKMNHLMNKMNMYEYYDAEEAFWEYFGQDNTMMLEYTMPDICNEFCQVLKQPRISFEMETNDDEPKCVLSVANVAKVDLAI